VPPALWYTLANSCRYWFTISSSWITTTFSSLMLSAALLQLKEPVHRVGSESACSAVHDHVLGVQDAGAGVRVQVGAPGQHVRPLAELVTDVVEVAAHHHARVLVPVAHGVVHVVQLVKARMLK
jgi:hypothetical protein